MRALSLAFIEGFVNPSILWLVPLALVPLVIYLFFRQRYQRVRWAAIEFLLRAARKHRRRIRIENLLMLLLRTAIVAAVVLATARPVTRSGVLSGLASGTRNWILVLDASYSMGYRRGARSLFAAARDEIRDLVQVLAPADRALLIEAADPPRVPFPEPVALTDEGKAEFLEALGELALSAEGLDISAVLAAVLDGLKRFPGAAGPTRIVLWSDFQARDWLAAGSGRASPGPRDPAALGLAEAIEKGGGRWSFVSLGPRWPENLSLLGLDVSEGVVGADVPLRFTARLRNNGPRRVDRVELALRVDGRVQGSARVPLEAGAETSVSFPYVFRTAGPHTADVELRSDPLAADNRAYRALAVRDRVRVLLVDGEPESDPTERETLYLEIALSPDEEPGGEHLSPYVFERVTAGELDSLRFDAWDVVVLANVSGLSERALGGFEAWMRAGGRAIIFLGKNVDREFYNDRLRAGGEGILPVELREVAGDVSGRWGVSMEIADPKHPIMRFFLESEGADLTTASVFRFFRCTAEGARVLARYTDPEASPAIVEGEAGAGRVIVVTTTADLEWNRFAKWPDYVAFLYESLSYLVRRSEEAVTLRVGERYHRAVPARAYASEVVVIGPSGRTSSRALVRKGDAFELEETATDEPGLYEVRYGGRGASRVEWFAVNVDPEEGALKKVDFTEFASAYPELAFEREEEGRRSWLRRREPRRTGGELWRSIACGLLALLALEGGLALWFGRRTR